MSNLVKGMIEFWLTAFLFIVVGVGVFATLYILVVLVVTLVQLLVGG